MKKNLRLVLTILTILFILGLIFYPKIKPLFQKNEEGPGGGMGGGGFQMRALQANGLVITPSNLREMINSTGTLLPDEEVDLSFETSGKIVSINFSEGARVKRGDLLAKINDRHLQAQLLKLQAQLKLAQEREFRQRNLLTRDAISQESYDQAVTELQALEADIMLLEARIAETELRAPFDGIIGLRYVSEGAYANPNARIAQLIKISPLKVEFSIPERYSGNVTPGFPITFTIDGINEPFSASVYAVDPKVDINTRTIVVRALYPNRREELKPGRFAGINLQLDEITNTIAIPTDAMIAEMDGDKVYVYRNGTAEQIKVETGLRTADEIQIVDGLSFGDTLLVTGVMQLRQGLPVMLDQVENPE
ncbi:MAG: efflux RND transporter periplasmic adaptor subunit [Bacteroides sp.]|jgi:membrane fusion protein (multidrug efflux system)|nr:efflux RND transporter periplasmic adaptor subunit [Bacteroides sp.]